MRLLQICTTHVSEELETVRISNDDYLDLKLLKGETMINFLKDVIRKHECDGVLIDNDDGFHNNLIKRLKVAGIKVYTAITRKEIIGVHCVNRPRF